MKDEIKEILDYLGNNKNYNCDCNDGSYYLELPYREAHELKDCITNLQKENEKLRKGYYTVKVGLEEIGVLNELKDYKSRNEKAIEYLIQSGFIDLDVKCSCGLNPEESLHLLNILQGSDKE